MPTITMFVVPSDYWTNGMQGEPGSLRPLLQEVLALRRRVAKGANQEAERSRFTNCLTDLESRPEFRNQSILPASAPEIIRAAKGRQIAGFALPTEYFDLLALSHLERIERQAGLETVDSVPAGAEIGSSVLSPKDLIAHALEVERFALTLTQRNDLQLLARERAEIARSIANTGSGIIEIGEELDNRVLPPPPERSVSRDKPAINPLHSESRQLTSKGRKRMVERFRLSIDQALPIKGKVNLSDQPHEVSTEVLSEYLFARAGQSASQVRVIYADGSEARPFPLCALPSPRDLTPPQIEPLDGIIELKLALMSMRHIELDPFVDRSWYRNKEVSVTRPLAESDEYCFQYSINELTELREVFGAQPILIRMFHTGFEPAAVGFYRAVAVELEARRGWLKVLPHYYRGGSRFEAGSLVWE